MRKIVSLSELLKHLGRCFDDLNCDSSFNFSMPHEFIIKDFLNIINKMYIIDRHLSLMQCQEAYRLSHCVKVHLCILYAI